MRLLCAWCVLAGLIVLTPSCGGGTAVSPQLQDGTVKFTAGDRSHSFSFVFQPDGASPTQSGADNGTRALHWPVTIDWARCDAQGEGCDSYETDSAPRCLHGGARIRLAWVQTKPMADTPGQQLLAWMKCLGR